MTNPIVESDDVRSSRRVLVTGASGYVGGRLVPELLGSGHTVRCVVRDPRKLNPAPWRSRVDVVRADIGGNLEEAMNDVDVAVYLVHSIGDGTDWVERERSIAENCRRLLVLHAEMRLPGEAWLEWSMEPVGAGTLLVHTARFRPRGLLGRLYWYAVAPFHRLAFPRLLNGIAHYAAGDHHE